MANPIQETPEDRNARRTSVSISGPADMAAVGGASTSVRGKTRTYYISSSQKNSNSGEEECRILSRYLRPPMASCHDKCKHGTHECEDSRNHTRLGTRKRRIVKNKGVRRTHVVLVERKKITRARPRPSPDPYIYAPAQPVQFSKHAKTTQNVQNNKKEIKTMKNTASKAARTGLLPPKPPVSSKGSKDRKQKLDSSPVKDQNSTQLIAENVEEKRLHEAETESEATHDTSAEIIQSPPTLTTETTNLSEEDDTSAEIIQSPPTPTTQSTNLLEEEPVSLSSESSSSELVDENELQSSCGKIILEECEDSNNEDGIIFEDDDDENGKSYRVVFCEDEDDDEDIKLRREKLLELLSDNGPRRLKFKRGKVLDANGEEGIARITFKKAVIGEKNEVEEGEKVNLKHQEVAKKEVQDLLNSVIEETASKLADKKTKVGALVGAFETVISLQDDD